MDRLNGKNTDQMVVKAILFLLASNFFFAMMSAFVRLAGDLPVMQKALFRNLVSASVAIAINIKKRPKIPRDRKRLTDLVIRSLAGTLGIITYFYTADHMAIADAVMLNKLCPFFIIIFSAWILKEPAGKKDWAIIALAFAGMIFVAKPSFSSEFIPSLIAIISGLMSGIAYTFLRKLGLEGVEGTVTVMFFSVFSSVFMLPFVIFNYVPMSMHQFVMLLLCGASAAGGQFCITEAYSRGAGRDISVFEYVQVLFAAVIGLVLFSELPDLWSCIGYVIIISAAVIRCYLFSGRKA